MSSTRKPVNRLPRNVAHSIQSVFNRDDCVVACEMIAEGKATRIEVRDFPSGAPTENDVGTPALFAIVLQTLADWNEFEHRVGQYKLAVKRLRL